ncbi:MAG: hypothetical protein K0S34_1129 [Bacillales bacterium]|jgi:hypothetical protein|nr:hypothetical protein [Bacillales bacterium]
MYQKLYEEQENSKVRFIGFTTDNIRYDFGIIYTSMFFGKPLVVCMQTGRSSLMDQNDVDNTELLKELFQLKNLDEASELSEILRDFVPALEFSQEFVD